jgi:uncharacterized protein (TIGR03437 family)
METFDRRCLLRCLVAGAVAGQPRLTRGQAGGIGDPRIVSAASLEPGLPPRGSLATLFCRGLHVESTTLSDGFPLPRELGGVRIWVGGASAPILALAERDGVQQVNFQVPYEARGEGTFDEWPWPMGTREAITSFLVEQQGRQAEATVVLRKSPGDFFRREDGAGLFVHSGDGSLVTDENPAREGETISAFLTGMRTETDPPVATGEPAPSSPPATLDKSHISLWRDIFDIYLTRPSAVRCSSKLLTRVSLLASREYIALISPCATPSLARLPLSSSSGGFAFSLGPALPPIPLTATRGSGSQTWSRSAFGRSRGESDRRTYAAVVEAKVVGRRPGN